VHVEFPQLGAIDVVIGFEHVVAAKFQRGFEATVIAINLVGFQKSLYGSAAL